MVSFIKAIFFLDMLCTLTFVIKLFLSACPNGGKLPFKIIQLFKWSLSELAVHILKIYR